MHYSHRDLRKGDDNDHNQARPGRLTHLLLRPILLPGNGDKLSFGRASQSTTTWLNQIWLQSVHHCYGENGH